MDNAKIVVRLLVLIGFSVGGWFLGFSRHKNIPSEDRIVLPRVFTYLFGKGDIDGVYNVRGVYLQIFTIIILVGFGLYVFDLLDLYWLSRIFLITLLIVFPVLEIARKVYSGRRKKS